MGYVGAAAHEALRPLLRGPTRPAHPLAATRTAVVLGIVGEPPVSLLAAEAVRLPGSLVLGVSAGDLALAAYGPDAPAAVGCGVLQIGDLVVRPTRWWASARVRPARPDVLDAAARRLGDRLLPSPHVGLLEVRLRRGLDGFADALFEALAARPRLRHTLDEVLRCRAAAEALLGLGPGLTPSGDDLVAGALVAVRRLLPDTADDIAVLGAALTEQARARTSPVSSALLAWATLGEAVPELLVLLDALGQDGPLRADLAGLTRVGHTSGVDLARGAVAGASVVVRLTARTVRPGQPARALP